MSDAYEHVFVEANGIRFHVVQAGPPDGPVAMLLHGFPEFWRGWASQIDALAAAGYRVWVPDQRGYGESDKPQGVDAYALETLADDICALIRSTGRDTVTLLGHDWGGVVSWRVAARNPELVRRLVIVNSPHLAVMLRHMSVGRQRLRSWYMHFFRIPRLPERLLRRHDFRGLVRVLRNGSRPGAFSDAEIAQYREAWSRPGALTAMLDWYRALMRDRSRIHADTRIPMPTLLLWGVQDEALGIEMAQPSIALCDRGELQRIEGAGHWVLHEEGADVSRRILGFLRGGAVAMAEPAARPVAAVRA
ncbi:alpha/beta hydrolase [Variovorax sp. J22G73]|uniref:alpha/beta fold hydrolase n=1 Tax=unclassified Variovorax TaxID=663243 RepID=UPI000D5EE0CD|nr:MULTISPECIES: alpha/beta hydrolase [unclassified Variovorax]MDM0003742.1 alpha/beta hydrolase [Variovorax sp. J22R203]MDM0096592.1 alpha/beta hydrolase [Variovorax sp. J22G73]